MSPRSSWTPRSHVGRGGRWGEGGHRVRVVTGDGWEGGEPGAPFDRIVVTASVTEVPLAWRDQLVEGGLVEAPLRLVPDVYLQAVVTLRRSGDSLGSTSVVPGGFMALRRPGGKTAPPPTLGAYRQGGGPPVVRLEGRPLDSLSAPAARRALVGLLEPGRPLGSLPADAVGGLMLFLLWSRVPRLVSCVVDGRSGVALLDRRGESVAAVLARPARIGVLTSWGGEEAAARLLEQVSRWERLGRPRIGDARLTVTEPNGHARPRGRRFPGAESVITRRWERRSAR